MQVLDHGYCNLVESWGSDERIIEAARMSTNKGFEGWGPNDCLNCGHLPANERINLHGTPLGKQGCEVCKGKGYVLGDEKLLAFLWNNKHATPFEMAGLIIEVQAPIFVFREWHRHRTQSYNEMSARYTSLPDVNYVPSIERLMINSKINKQAGTIKGAEELTESKARHFRDAINCMYAAAEAVYQEALQTGVPKELARIHLPVGRYSRMRASANLRNWLGFLTLRADNKAQWEIRQYAFAVSDLIKQAFPRTHTLWEAGMKNV
jgi:thymidylate synthase (FAD)